MSVIQEKVDEQVEGAEEKKKLRRPFVFCLLQNFAPQLAEGMLAYQIHPDRIDFDLKPIFFIGIGIENLIVGPFELTGAPIYEPFVECRVRMLEIDPIYGLWIETLKECPFRVSFRPLVQIQYGIKWDSLAPQIGVDPTMWQNLSEVWLPEDVIQEIAEKLREANPPI